MFVCVCACVSVCVFLLACLRVCEREGVFVYTVAIDYCTINNSMYFGACGFSVVTYHMFTTCRLLLKNF